MFDNKNEINILREKLDKSIMNGDDYSEIYKLSIELDQLVAEYYKKGDTDTQICH